MFGRSNELGRFTECSDGAAASPSLRQGHGEGLNRGKKQRSAVEGLVQWSPPFRGDTDGNTEILQTSIAVPPNRLPAEHFRQLHRDVLPALPIAEVLRRDAVFLPGSRSRSLLDRCPSSRSDVVLGLHRLDRRFRRSENIAQIRRCHQHAFRGYLAIISAGCSRSGRPRALPRTLQASSIGGARFAEDPTGARLFRGFPTLGEESSGGRIHQPRARISLRACRWTCSICRGSDLRSFREKRVEDSIIRSAYGDGGFICSSRARGWYVRYSYEFSPFVFVAAADRDDRFGGSGRIADRYMSCAVQLVDHAWCDCGLQSLPT